MVCAPSKIVEGQGKKGYNNKFSLAFVYWVVRSYPVIGATLQFDFLHPPSHPSRKWHRNSANAAPLFTLRHLDQHNLHSYCCTNWDQTNVNRALANVNGRHCKLVHEAARNAQTVSTSSYDKLDFCASLSRYRLNYTQLYLCWCSVYFLGLNYPCS